MLKNASKSFTIVVDGEQIAVEEYVQSSSIIYLLKLKKEDPIFITEAEGSDGKSFWTSIPEGRLALAIRIGKLIEELKKKPEQIKLL